MSSRIHHPGLRSKVMSAAEAAAFIQHGTTVGMSGFTGSGYPKAVPTALAERDYIEACRALGAGWPRILFRHILPVVLPTLVTIATLDFAFVMLAESSLSFLGIGIQAPEITWGLMVSQGRQYLTTAWWLSFWPGLAIILTTLSLNLLSNWLRIALDPAQRWRLEMRGRKND